jgi:hypothetical protein
LSFLSGQGLSKHTAFYSSSREAAFAGYTATYAKSYTTLTEYNSRRSLYEVADDFISSFNSVADQTMTVKHNRSSDWTDAEKASRLDSYKGSSQPSKSVAKQAAASSNTPRTQDNPAALDWRDYLGYSVVSDVRD